MKKKIYIVHGWDGSSAKAWTPWAKGELQNLGHEVIFLDMPDPEVPKIGLWVEHLREVVTNPNENTYFIGHSIGCQTILRYLETVDAKVGGAIFVAGWFALENLEDGEVEDIARPWLSIPIDTNKIKNVLTKSVLLISDNDPYGGFDENVEKFSDLGSEIIVIPDAGHFTADDGFGPFEKLVEIFKNKME